MSVPNISNIGKIQIQSTAGAVPVRTEKGKKLGVKLLKQKFSFNIVSTFEFRRTCNGKSESYAVYCWKKVSFTFLFLKKFTTIYKPRFLGQNTPAIPTAVLRNPISKTINKKPSQLNA